MESNVRAVSLSGNGQHLSANRLAEITGKTVQAIHQRAKRDGWRFEVIIGRGKGRGKPRKEFDLSSLPTDVQRSVVDSSGACASMIPALAPEVAIDAQMRLVDVDAAFDARPSDSWESGGMDMAVLRDPRVKRLAGIVREALEVPKGWKKTKWLKAVAVKHNTTKATLYKWIKKYEKEGLSGLSHTKGNAGQPKAWNPEAVDYWVGLCLKRSHRKISKEALYGILEVEAAKQGWSIGTYGSALWWLNKKVTPQLTALQRGGSRALDNMLPPVVRDYSDLAPFEILVGDQHRFDFWVVDDDTGDLFRPEGYFWQDLRSRLFYGGAVDKKYDSQLIGLALRIGINIFGAFTAIYTDNGKPELSRYVMGIMGDMRTLGLDARQTVDAPFDSADPDEALNPCVIAPGSHKKAIVKNAKAKMIEGTFMNLERVLRDVIRLPGYVKRLTDCPEDQDIDTDEVQRLHRAGKLPLFSEYVPALFRAMEYYNREKVHRGVKNEWIWTPKPKTATPMDCLKRCYLDGWRPRWLSAEAVDLVFMAREPRGRVVDRGRVLFRSTLYEHDDLVGLSGKRVDIRFDPMDLSGLLVFSGGRFVCRAVPVEYSSMKDQDLASRKIEQKRKLRKSCVEEYRRLTSGVPDFLNYSQVPQIERDAAEVAAARLRDAAQASPGPVDTGRLDAEIRRIEAYQTKDRPIFSSQVERYRWCLDQDGALIAEDVQFMAEYAAGMDEDTRTYWEIYRESVAG